MTITAGTEVYNVDSPPVTARGATYNDTELDTALGGSVSHILWDDAGTAALEPVFTSLAETAFEVERVKQILTTRRPVENWRVGEGLAEAFLVEHRKCEFPWPSGRDLKNPSASPAGTDLVGFQQTDEVINPQCFAFGEVKTSDEEIWPPNVTYGRHGLKAQLENLRDSIQVKHDLVLYLGHHAAGVPWLPSYKSATKRYLSNSSDVSIYGILVRDVDPKPEDLQRRAAALAIGCPSKTCVELRAMYLPKGTISSLGERAERARESSHARN